MIADPQTQEQPTAASSVDIRPDIKRLLNAGLDWDGVGDAEFVLEELSRVLEIYPDLLDHIAEQTANFAQETSSDALSLRLVVSDQKPDDVEERDPSRIVLYEEEGMVQGNIAIRTMRLTSSGTRSSVANMSDLDAYMAADKKRRVILYLGSFRLDDLTAVDLDFEALIDTLGAMGMSENAIEDMVKLLLSGEAPASMVEAVQQLLALPAADATPQQVTQVLAKLDQAVVDAVQTLPPRLQPLLASIQSGLQPVMQTPPSTLVQKMTSPAPQQPSEKIAALKIMASVVQTTATLLKDPALPPQDKARLKEGLSTVRLNMFKEGGSFAQAFQNLAMRIAPLAENVQQKDFSKGPLSLAQDTSLFSKITQVTASLARVVVLLTPPDMRASLPLPTNVSKGDQTPTTLKAAPYSFVDAMRVVNAILPVPMQPLAAMRQPTVAAPILSRMVPPASTLNSWAAVQPTEIRASRSAPQTPAKSVSPLLTRVMMPLAAAVTSVMPAAAKIMPQAVRPAVPTLAQTRQTPSVASPQPAVKAPLAAPMQPQQQQSSRQAPPVIAAPTSAGNDNSTLRAPASPTPTQDNRVPPPVEIAPVKPTTIETKIDPIAVRDTPKVETLKQPDPVHSETPKIVEQAIETPVVDRKAPDIDKAPEAGPERKEAEAKTPDVVNKQDAAQPDNTNEQPVRPEAPCPTGDGPCKCFKDAAADPNNPNNEPNPKNKPIEPLPGPITPIERKTDVIMRMTDKQTTAERPIDKSLFGGKLPPAMPTGGVLPTLGVPELKDLVSGPHKCFGDCCKPKKGESPPAQRSNKSKLAGMKMPLPGKP